jgi:3-oxoadipate enol-lactonase
MQATVGDFATFLARSHDGLQLTVFDSGDENRPVALLLNAYGMPVELMVPLAQQLASEFRVVSWTCRGMPADTSDRAIRWGLTDHCDDIRAVLEHCRVERVSVGIGWCSGARLLLYFAARYPALLGRAVLINGAYRFPGLPRTPYQDRLEPVLASVVGNASLAQIFCGVMRGVAETPQVIELAASLKDPSLLALVQAPYVDAEHLERYAALCSHDNARNDLAILPEVSIPVHVIASELDRISHPEASRKISQALKGATYHLVPGADHYIAYSRPGDIVDICRSVWR